MASEAASDAIGYLAAFIACLVFGSFCVPMKGKAATSIDVDPLVFTTYSTVTCFMMSLVVLLFDRNLTFTPLGIISGMFWVSAGVARVCAVRAAGLILSQGIMSCMGVIVSFSWGIFVFHERVRNTFFACFAITLVVGGICGMSYFSDSELSSCDEDFMIKDIEAVEEISCGASSQSESVVTVQERFNSRDSYSGVSTTKDDSSIDDESSSCFSTVMILDDDNFLKPSKSTLSFSESLGTDRTMLLSLSDYGRNHDSNSTQKQSMTGTTALMNVLVRSVKRKYNLNISPKQLGILLAALGGAWCGCIMVPLHYAGEDYQGLDYFFSFAAGAMIVNIFMWWLLVYYHYERTNSIVAAYNALPSFHLKSMLVPGALSGILQSIGNIGCIISVTYLGEGVGFSITQSSILISGLWGIFWFREITSKSSIHGWLIAAVITILGIIILGFNHLPPTAQIIMNNA